MTAPGLTGVEVAARIGCSLEFTLQLLEDEARRGFVQRVGERWVATPTLITKYGPALRALEPLRRRETP